MCLRAKAFAKHPPVRGWQCNSIVEHLLRITQTGAGGNISVVEHWPNTQTQVIYNYNHIAQW